jgi:anti-sigma B factor antagonist
MTSDDAGATTLAMEELDDGVRATLTLRGDLDMTTSPRLVATGVRLARAGIRIVELDLSDVELVDSSGLGAIIDLNRRMQDAGGALHTIGLSSAARRILELTGVIDHLRHHQPA